MISRFKTLFQDTHTFDSLIIREEKFLNIPRYSNERGSREILEEIVNADDRERIEM